MLLLSVKARIRGDAMDACGVVKARKGGGQAGLEAALLSRGEVVRQREGGQLIESAVDALELELELCGAGRDGEGTKLGA